MFSAPESGEVTIRRQVVDNVLFINQVSYRDSRPSFFKPEGLEATRPVAASVDLHHLPRYEMEAFTDITGYDNLVFG